MNVWGRECIDLEKNCHWKEDSQGLHVKPTAFPGLLFPGEPHRCQGWHWVVPWLGMGMLRGPVPNKCVLGGQCRRRIPDSDSAAQLFLPRAIASTGETRLDQVQGFKQPLRFSLFHLKQALVQVNVLTSEHLCEARPLWVNLEYTKPKDAMPEGEECSVWKDVL